MIRFGLMGVDGRTLGSKQYGQSEEVVVAEEGLLL